MAVDGRPAVLVAAADAMIRSADRLDDLRRATGEPVRTALAGWRSAAAQVATERVDEDLDVLARAADACRRAAPALRAYAEHLQRAQADASEGQRMVADADRVLGAGVVEIGAQQRARTDLETGTTILRSAEDARAVAAEDAARVVGEAAAMLPDPVDVERGNLLDGLAKAGGDLVDEVGTTLSGALDHVNVFSDRLGETWSRTGATVAAAATDPMGAVGAVVDGVTAPIGDSYRTGGVDEAAGRTVGAIATALVGGKGLTKLGKLAPEEPTVPTGLASAYPLRRAPGGGLRAHEDLGRHTLREQKAHVGASDARVLQRLEEEGHRFPISAYQNRVVAERAVHDNMTGNAAAVDAWLNDPTRTVPGRFTWEHGHDVGRSAPRGAETPADIVDVSRSRVVLKKDPTAPLGYYILTTFPER